MRSVIALRSTHGFLLRLCFALCLSASPALAQRSGAQQNLLQLGQQQYDDLRYEEALQTLSAALLRPGNTPQSERQLYELLGLSYLALNRREEAEGAFRLLLVRDPTRSLSNDLAPRIREFFEQVKRRWEADGRPGVVAAAGPTQRAPATVVIEHRSPVQQERNRAVPLTATVTDPDNRVARLVLAYRSAVEGRLFRRTDAERSRAGGPFHAELPGEVVRPPAVEYYLEAVDGNGVPVMSRGDAFAPLRVVVPEPRGIPWWVWVVGGGAVAAGVAVTAIVVATANAPARLDVEIVGR